MPLFLRVQPHNTSMFSMFEFLWASVTSRRRADESSRLCDIEVPGPEVRAVAASDAARKASCCHQVEPLSQ